MEILWILIGVVLGIVGGALALFVLGFIACLIFIPFSMGWAAAAKAAESILG